MGRQKIISSKKYRILCAYNWHGRMHWGNPSDGFEAAFSRWELSRKSAAAFVMEGIFLFLCFIFWEKKQTNKNAFFQRIFMNMTSCAEQVVITDVQMSALFAMVTLVMALVASMMAAMRTMATMITVMMFAAKVTKITTWLQAAARGSLARLQYIKLRWESNPYLQYESNSIPLTTK